MALDSLLALDQFKATPFTPGYPADARTFFSPVDDVHGALKAVLQAATKSIVIAMYGYDDPELNAIVRQHLESEHVYVQLSLDSSQAAGVAERKILETWQHDGPGNSIAIGQSERGAIQHLKLVIVDGLDVIQGSTNWSTGGETKQDNQCTIVRNALVAAESRARLDVIHDSMLQKMVGRRARLARLTAVLPIPPRA